MGNLVTFDILSVFRGKRVLVTGDTGFKGSWLSLWLHDLGADVMGYALPPRQDDDHYHLLGLGDLIHHVDGDIRDLSFLEKVCFEFQPEFIFHLAAQSLVRMSYEMPKVTFDTNVGGSVNILEMARALTSLRVLIYVTSDKCYRNKEWIWGYREVDELGGDDPYSASKAAAEIIFNAYVAAFFSKRRNFGAASVRAGNVIGGGDWSSDRIVPDCIRALKSGNPIVLRNPDATRPWQHVMEPLFGYLLLASRLYHSPKMYAGSWNFGPTDEAFRTVRNLAEGVVRFWGEGEVIVAPQSDDPVESMLLHLNCDKAKRLLSWSCGMDFEATVAKTVEWYKGVYSGTNVLEMSRRQISDYGEVRK